MEHKKGKIRWPCSVNYMENNWPVMMISYTDFNCERAKRRRRPNYVCKIIKKNRPTQIDENSKCREPMHIQRRRVMMCGLIWVNTVCKYTFLVFGKVLKYGRNNYQIKIHIKLWLVESTWNTDYKKNKKE